MRRTDQFGLPLEGCRSHGRSQADIILAALEKYWPDDGCPMKDGKEKDGEKSSKGKEPEGKKGG